MCNLLLSEHQVYVARMAQGPGPRAWCQCHGAQLPLLALNLPVTLGASVHKFERLGIRLSKFQLQLKLVLIEDD